MMKKVKVEEVKSNLTNRRSFLKISGLAIAGTGLVLAGCNNDDDGGMAPPVDNQLPGVRNGVFDLGGGDAGILTYAYALEQLEADFYTRVVNGNNFGSVFSSEEQTVLTDLYNHEVIHREFFRAALTGALNDPDRLLPDLNFDYGDLNFSNRLQVLNTAKTLEDTGVAAYNGAGRYITTPDYLVIAGKIVSVEARHASAIRSLLNPGSADFAGDDVIDANGLDLAQMPSQILAAVGSLGVVQTPFTAQFLP
ncbi:ferritin-like domain-containing protein [Flavobacterium alkalisoli]|uniref:Ferritin-like domain-containing protein n=1 Tax=Flavobacterium alkalisoli TaxID=2602769 RepID=A0A5B9FPD3_9FLAO|nr:ferritin-like domain-containing protein [Flavobacterium alkalisoli]